MLKSNCDSCGPENRPDEIGFRIWRHVLKMLKPNSTPNVNQSGQPVYQNVAHEKLVE